MKKLNFSNDRYSITNFGVVQGVTLESNNLLAIRDNKTGAVIIAKDGEDFRKIQDLPELMEWVAKLFKQDEEQNK